MQYNIHAAKTQLSKLVARAAAGEEIILAVAGKPAARLMPLSEQKSVRKPGLFKGKIKMSANFDAPIDPEDWYAPEV